MQHAGYKPITSTANHLHAFLWQSQSFWALDNRNSSMKSQKHITIWFFGIIQLARIMSLQRRAICPIFKAL